MGRLLAAALLVMSLAAATLTPAAAWGDEGADTAALKAQIEELKARLDKLEMQLKDAQSGQPKAGGQCAAQPGASLSEASQQAANPEPKSGLSCLEIVGDVTATAQGTANNRHGDQTGANVRADLFMTAKPTQTTQLGFHFLVSRGGGVNSTPGALGGLFDDTFLGNPNANIQYNSDIPHLVEAWLQQSFLNERVVATLGLLDPTVYFDTNRFANDEQMQFMGTMFVDNPGIDWGGDVDFYGPGVRVSVNATEWLSLSAGGFATQTVSDLDSDEVVGFKGGFDRPFAILEADFKVKPWGREGNYRFYGWYNANKERFARFDSGEQKASWGGGGSFDQDLTDKLGAFLRWSKQDDSVRRLDWHVSGGLSAKGLVPGRPDDVAALGYALGYISREFRDANPCPHATEHWIEAYYSGRLTPSLFLGPDLQYVVGACGDHNDIFIWGLRAHAQF